MAVDEALLDYADLSAYLKLSESYLRRLVARRGIPLIRIGRAIRFRKQAIDAWMGSEGGGDGVRL